MTARNNRPGGRTDDEDRHPWVYPESDFEGLEGSSKVEQMAVNHPVEGSSPSPSATLVKRLRVAKMDWRAHRKSSAVLFGEAADALEDLERVLADAEKGGYEQAAALAAKDAEIEALKDENANLRALLPHHEYQGQDK